MKDLPKEFTTSNLYSFHSLAALVVTASIFLIGVIDFITGKVTGSIFASMFLLPWFLIVLLIKLTSRVKFERDYIEQKTLIGKTRIKWVDIKSFGVYSELWRFKPQVVDASEVEHHSPLVKNFIFVSPQPYFDSVNLNNGIVFEYRKDIYDRLKNTFLIHMDAHEKHKGNSETPIDNI